MGVGMFGHVVPSLPGTAAWEGAPWSGFGDLFLVWGLKTGNSGQGPCLYGTDAKFLGV